MTLYNAFWLFCIYSVLGWCLEVCFCTIRHGQFVNRGFLNGPVCPIYGFGMVMVLWLLEPVQDNLVLLFLGGMLLTSGVELLGGWALQKLFHTSWWNYSDKKFNIGGYICLQFSLAWGVAVVVAVRIINPGIQWVVDHVPHIIGQILAVPVALLFVCDLIVTVKAIAKLNRSLGAIDEVAKALHKGSDTLAEDLGEKALAVDRRVDTGYTEARERLEEGRTEAQMRFDVARAELLDRKNYVAHRLMRAFPRVRHQSHADALEQLKEWLREKDRTRRQK